MKDYFYVNPSMMVEYCRELSGSEFKVLLGMMYCMSETNSSVFINCTESRQTLASLGYEKTPERISAVLSSLVKKGIIYRKAQGVFTLPENLFKLP